MAGDASRPMTAVPPSGWPVILLLLDGVADWPCRDLDGATSSRPPPPRTLTGSRRRGCRACATPSDPGNARAASSPSGATSATDAQPPARAVLEAAGAGLEIPAGAVHMNLALRSAGVEAGHLRRLDTYMRDDDPDALKLLEALHGMTVDHLEFSVRYVQRAEGLPAVFGPDVSPAVSDADPFSAGQLVHQVEPLDEAADPDAAGIATLSGARLRRVPEDPDPAIELARKVEEGLDAVAGGAAFVYTHTQAPNEAGHRHDPSAKRDVIAVCDRGFAALQDQRKYVLAVTADDGTSSWGPLLHSGDAVPLAIRGPSVRIDAVQSFDEHGIALGGLGTLRGEDLLPVLVDAAGRGRFLGRRQGRRHTPAAPTDALFPKLDDEPLVGEDSS